MLGAILAGGRNTRYGALKALETVGGRRIIDRVIESLEAVTPDLILITNDFASYESVGLPKRGDRVQGLGALGGIDAALRWADELEHDGILAAACDMPFVSGPLLQRLAEESEQADVVIPESSNRRGVEPLCAYYSTRCLPALDRAIERGDHRMISFHGDLAVKRIPIEEVREFGDPDILFLNVNTIEERDRAERIAATQ